MEGGTLAEGLEDGVMRKIFGPKQHGVKEDRIRLDNVEHHDLYFSPDIIWAIKVRKVRFVKHVARMGKLRGPYRVLSGNAEGK
jgi:hypothetical protein